MKKNKKMPHQRISLLSDKILSNKIKETVNELSRYENNEEINALSALNTVLGTLESEENAQTNRNDDRRLKLIHSKKKMKNKQEVLNDIINQLPEGSPEEQTNKNNYKNNHKNNMLKNIIYVLNETKKKKETPSETLTNDLKKKGIIPLWEQLAVQQKTNQYSNIDKTLLLFDIRRALEEREFFYFYQPQWNINTGEIVCLESCLRWRHPTKGILGPDFFLTLFEGNNMLLDLMNILFEQIFTDLNQMKLNGLDSLKISIHLTPEQLELEYLGESLIMLLERMNIQSSQIECAVTERLFPKYPPLLRENITVLKENGITLCLNNFASGYSAYPYLQEFHFDKIKLDKTYTMHLFENPREKLIVQSVIDQARLFDSQAVIDGINSPQMLHWLRQHNCTLGQGCLLGKARPLEEMIDFLKEYNTIKSYGIDSIEAFWRRNAHLTPINTGSCVEE